MDKLGWHICADVAQLVEQRYRKPQVTGSSPVIGSRKIVCHAQAIFLLCAILLVCDYAS